ncbi:uncharacterized protein [Nicotiana tomentosiformis]|uniref:uncharacterized protein n=1 Tax=Nicotiana tomentosiformis TaxID=4098 RepID=UPI00388CECDB
MALYEALYGRLYHSSVGWFQLGEARLLGTDLVCDALEKIFTHEGCDEGLEEGQVEPLKYYRDPSHVLDFSTVQLDEDFTYDVEPVNILVRLVQTLRSNTIASVKVHWRGHPTEESTWENKKEMQSRYPHLFETPSKILDSFEDEHLFKRGKI